MEILWIVIGVLVVWFIIDLVRVQDVIARMPQDEQDRFLVGTPLTPETREFLHRRLYFPNSSRRFLLVLVLVFAIGIISKLLGL
jgi:hypothetical protein